MQDFYKATFFQRAVAYIVDFILIGILVYYTQFAIRLLLDGKGIFDYTGLNESEKVLQEVLNGNRDKSEYIELSKQYLLLETVDTVIGYVLSFIYCYLYLVLIQFKLKGITLGRFIAKIKVVKKDNSEIIMKDVYKRELLGAYLFYTTFSILPWVGLAIYFVKGMSVCDLISKTKLVDEKKFDAIKNSDIIDINVENEIEDDVVYENDINKN